MPATSNHLYSEMDRSSSDEIMETRAFKLAYELSLLRFPTDGSAPAPEPESSANFGTLLDPLTILDNIVEDCRSKKSQNMTECVPVPSSEHVAEIVGRQGCKIKALRAKTNTYIKTPVRGEEPVFVVTGRKEDVAKAKREILSAAEHFSQIRASRKNNLIGGLNGAPPGPPTNIPGQVTIQVRVPYRVVGLVVGPKGATIKRIQHQTHTYIVTPSRDKEPVFEVTGLPESVELARKEIQSHIALRTGAGASPVGDLGPFGGGSTDDEPRAVDMLVSMCKNGLDMFFGNSLGGGGDAMGMQRSSVGSVGNGGGSGSPGVIGSGDPFSNMGASSSSTGSSSASSGAFSSSRSCSSTSSSSGGRPDLGAIWGSASSGSDRDEGLGDSPSFDSSGLNSIWSYPSPPRPSPPHSTSPAESLLNSASSPPVGLAASATSSSPGGTAPKACLVCSNAKVTHALIPCGHNCFCSECAERICRDAPEGGQCPVCSIRVSQSIRILSVAS